MKNILVTVQPKHLKDNNWSHKENVEGWTRRCPLEEALKEMFPTKTINVRSQNVDIDNVIYKIPNLLWNVGTVTTYIEWANQGTETEYYITLKPIEK